MFRHYDHCPRGCGALQTRRIPAPNGQERRVCDVCGFVFWNNSRPTAGAIVVDDSGRILLGKRAIAPSKDLWDLPGGFLEPGELPELGARRELLEETGLIVELSQLLGFYIDQYGDDPRDFTLNIFYVATIVGGEPRADDDVSELRFFDPDDLPHPLAFRSVVDAIADWKRSR